METIGEKLVRDLRDESKNLDRYQRGLFLDAADYIEDAERTIHDHAELLEAMSYPDCGDYENGCGLCLPCVRTRAFYES